MKIATCLGCGCTDTKACDDGLGGACHWLKVDRARGVGVCSQCHDRHALLASFDRKPAAKAKKK